MDLKETNMRQPLLRVRSLKSVIRFTIETCHAVYKEMKEEKY